MAKKTVKVDLRSAGAEPAAGDVNISYKGTRIAGLTESSTAVLETENTIVQDDIEVEYNKPEPVAVTIPVYYKERRALSAVLINNTPALPGTKMSFEIGELTTDETIYTSETGWTDDTMIEYTADPGINAEFSQPVLTVDFYQPKELPTGKTRYVITFD